MCGHYTQQRGGGYEEKNIRFTSLELQRELVAFMVEHYFFSCKKYKKNLKSQQTMVIQMI